MDGHPKFVDIDAIMHLCILKPHIPLSYNKTGVYRGIYFFLGDFFFISWFTDPPTQIFAFLKKIKYFLLFLFFSDVKNCQI